MEELMEKNNQSSEGQELNYTQFTFLLHPKEQSQTIWPSDCHKVSLAPFKNFRGGNMVG